MIVNYAKAMQLIRSFDRNFKQTKLTIMKKLLIGPLFLASALISSFAHSQLIVGASGNVGIGGRQPSSTYDVNTSNLYSSSITSSSATSSSATSSYTTVNSRLGVGVVAWWSNSNKVHIGGLEVTGHFLYIGSNPNSNSGAELKVNGEVSATKYNLTSDKRLKTQIKDIEKDSLIDRLATVEGKTFKYKNRSQLLALHNSGKVRFVVDTVYRMDSVLTDHGYERVMTNEVDSVFVDVPNFSRKRRYGLLAQNVKKEFPELVTKDTLSKILTVNYNGFIPILIEAFKEQQKKIDKQEEELKALKRAVDSLAGGQAPSAGPGARMSAPAALNAKTQAVSLTAYPNPTGGKVNFKFNIPEIRQKASVHIYRLDGQEIAQYPIGQPGKGEISLDIGGLGSGIYLYSLIVDGEIAASPQKIVVNK